MPPFPASNQQTQRAPHASMAIAHRRTPSRLRPISSQRPFPPARSGNRPTDLPAFKFLKTSRLGLSLNFLARSARSMLTTAVHQTHARLPYNARPRAERTVGVEILDSDAESQRHLRHAELLLHGWSNWRQRNAGTLLQRNEPNRPVITW